MKFDLKSWCKKKIMSIFGSNFQPDSLVLQLSTLLKIGKVITDNKQSKCIPHLRMICFNIIKKIHSLLKTNPYINDSCIYNTSNVQQTLGFDNSVAYYTSITYDEDLRF